MHKLGISHSRIYLAYGGLHGDTFFSQPWQPPGSTGPWTLCYYFEGARRQRRDYSLSDAAILSDEYAAAQQEAWRSISVKLDPLMNDAEWLARSIGFSKIPGTDGIDATHLSKGGTTWIWLVFHAAWEKPEGTILRAGKEFPVSMLTADIVVDMGVHRMGFDPAKTPGLEGLQAAKRAARERDKNLPREQRLAEWDEASKISEERSTKMLLSGSYLSRLPCDPFTASASLIELMILSDEGSPKRSPDSPRMELESESWSAPMSKREMARRITGKQSARAREVEPALAQYGIKRVGDKKWMVCLDRMDANTRNKIEAGG